MDLVFNSLTDSVYRKELRRRLKDYTIAGHNAPTGATITALTQTLMNGRGNHVKPQDVDAAMAFREVVLLIIEDMVDNLYAIDPVTGDAVIKEERIQDVIAMMLIYTTYLNITESEATYNQAFPTIVASGANHLFSSKLVTTFKQLTQIYNKAAFMPRAFSLQLTLLYINNLETWVAPFISDTQASSGMKINDAGDYTTLYDPTDLIFAKLWADKKTVTESVIADALPSTFAKYIPGIMTSLETYFGTKTILSDIVLTITTDKVRLEGQDLPQDLNYPTFTDPLAIKGMSLTDFLTKEPSLVVPIDSFYTSEFTSVTTNDKAQLFTWYILNAHYIHDHIYNVALTLKTEMKEAYDDLKIANTAMIPGLTVELALEKPHVSDSFTTVNVLKDIPMMDITKQARIPNAMPPYVIKFGETDQRWIFEPLVNNAIRPRNIIASYAMGLAPYEGIFNNFGYEVKDSSFNQEDILPTFHWVWTPDYIPKATVLMQTGFDFNPIPYAYTKNLFPGSFANNAQKFNEVMTKAKATNLTDEYDWEQIMAMIAKSPASQNNDIALSLAGVGFIFELGSDGKYTFINPNIGTIYGMPTSWMYHENITKTKVLDELSKAIKDAKHKLHDRLVFDRSVALTNNKSNSTATSIILVLHNRVPRMHELTHVAILGRKGFRVRLPLRKDLARFYRNRLLLSVNNKMASIKTYQDMDLDNLANYNDKRIKLREAFQSYSQAYTTDLYSINNAEPLYSAILAAGGKDELPKTLPDFLDQEMMDNERWSYLFSPYQYLSMANMHTLLQVGDSLLEKIYMHHLFEMRIRDKSERNTGTYNVLMRYIDDRELIEAEQLFAFEAGIDQHLTKVGTMITTDMITKRDNPKPGTGEFQIAMGNIKATSSVNELVSATSQVNPETGSDDYKVDVKSTTVMSEQSITGFNPQKQDERLGREHKLHNQETKQGNTDNYTNVYENKSVDAMTELHKSALNKAVSAEPLNNDATIGDVNDKSSGSMKDIVENNIKQKIGTDKRSKKKDDDKENKN